MGGDENTAKLREPFLIPLSTPGINLLSIPAFRCMLYADCRENGGRGWQRPNLLVYVPRGHPEPAQMIPSLQEGELRDDVLLRHVGSGHEKIRASSGTVCTGCSRHGIILEILDSPS